MNTIARIIQIITNKIMSSCPDITCSAEWLYEKGRNEALFEVLGAVERIDPQGWIPCSEKVPEVSIHEGFEDGSSEWDCSESVLVYHNDDAFNGHMTIGSFTVYSDGKRVWSDELTYHSINNVVAWMPLPEPYKDEQ